MSASERKVSAAVNSSSEAAVGTHAIILNKLKNLGRAVVDECRKESKTVSPVLAALTVRIVCLQFPDKFPLEGISADAERELLKVNRTPFHCLQHQHDAFVLIVLLCLGQHDARVVSERCELRDG